MNSTYELRKFGLNKCTIKIDNHKNKVIGMKKLQMNLVLFTMRYSRFAARLDNFYTQKIMFYVLQACFKKKKYVAQVIDLN